MPKGVLLMNPGAARSVGLPASKETAVLAAVPGCRAKCIPPCAQDAVWKRKCRSSLAVTARYTVANVSLETVATKKLNTTVGARYTVPLRNYDTSIDCSTPMRVATPSNGLSPPHVKAIPSCHDTPVIMIPTAYHTPRGYRTPKRITIPQSIVRTCTLSRGQIVPKKCGEGF